MRLLTARVHRLMPEVIRRIGLHAAAGEPCMLLVPSQYTLQAEIEVMTQLELPGSFLIDVLSPSRLQGRVFERAGAPAQVVLDQRGTCMVLTEIVEQEKENLTVYRAAAENGTEGFVQKLAELIANLKRSEATAQAVSAGLEELAKDSASREKLADVARLYAAYEQRMAGQLADGEDVARLMREKLAGSGLLANRHICVCGFDMITGTFARDLLAMSRCCASLTLAIETDADSAPDGCLYGPVNESLDRLAQMAAQEGVRLEWERLDAALDAPEDIRAMERNLFAPGRCVGTKEPANIELHAGSTMRAEVHAAAARMRALAAAGEASEEMAVVYPEGSGYGPLLAGILPMYGITAYIAQKRPARSHPLCRFVLSALRTVSGGFATADVVEYIRSGFVPIAQEEADALIAYAEGTGVRADGWRRPFTYAADEDEEALARLNRGREATMAPLLSLRRALGRARTADDTVTAILRLLEDVNAFDRLGDMRLELQQAGLEPEAQDCAQVWNVLMETLDQLHTLLGGRAVPAQTVLGLLSGGLCALELSALPPADGAVVCGEIGNVRPAQVRTLFALGMNDAPDAAEDGLLTGAERAEAAEATRAYLGMSAADRSALAQLDTLKALTGVTQRLIVSYALADETGRALREGATVQALRRAFPALSVSGGLAEEESEAMLSAPETAMEALAVHLSRVSDGRETLGAPYAQTYAALATDGRRRDRLEAMTRRLCAEPARRLNAQQARGLYGRPVMSVSRLEMAAQCPYRHFVRYGLCPQQEKEPGVDRAELGTLYHEAAEQFSRAVTALPGFPEVDAETCDRLMDEALAPLIAQWRTSPLGESARGGAIAGRIRKTARRAGRSILSQFAQSRFRPGCFELTFGQNGVAPVILSLGDGSCVYLQGRIDRIDVLDGQRIRIVDYKSGVKRFDPTMAYWGIQLQLLIYLAAALEQMPGAQPAGFFYCRIADPTVKSESRIKEEVERQIAQKLALAGISLSDVEILRAQDEAHGRMITRDGKPSGRYAASMVDEAGMQALVDFARQKAAQLARQTYAGEIDDAPAVLGAYNACSTCKYAAVCGFDATRGGRRYLTKKKLNDLTGQAE